MVRKITAIAQLTLQRMCIRTGYGMDEILEYLAPHHQFIVGSMVNDLALRHNHDFIAFIQMRYSMCHQQSGLIESNS